MRITGFVAGSCLLTILILLSASSAHADSVILDRSPAAVGTGNTDTNWANFYTGQNFAERFSFVDAMTLTGMDIYSSEERGALNQSVSVRIWSDNGGTPDALLLDAVETISELDTVGATQGLTRKHVDLDTPFMLSAGTTYWIGMSGRSTDLAQFAFRDFPYDDGKMAQFNNTTYGFMTTVGDMAFRLHGAAAVPEPGSLSLLGLALVGLVIRRRR